MICDYRDVIAVAASSSSSSGSMAAVDDDYDAPIDLETVGLVPKELLTYSYPSS